MPARAPTSRAASQRASAVPPSPRKRAAPKDVDGDVEMATSPALVNGFSSTGSSMVNGNGKSRAAQLVQEATGEKSKKIARRGSLRGPPVKLPIPQAPDVSVPPKELFVFGCGDMGQFGLGPDELEDIPRPRFQTWFKEHADELRREGSSAPGGLETMAAGGMHTLTVDDNGRVRSWGINDNACLGRVTSGVADPENPDRTIDNEDLESWPLVVEALQKEGFRAVSVAAGDSISLAVSDKGEMRAWGSFRQNEGILGFDGVPGHPRFQFTPMAIPSFERNRLQIVQVASGNDHVLALTSAGHVYVWGNGQQNQLGRRIIERRITNGLEPERLGLRNIVHVAAGSYHSFAVDSSGTVWAWGLNTYHQTGLTSHKGGDQEMVMVPGQVDALSPDLHGGSKVIQITGGEHHSLFLFDNGEVWACGRSESHQTGFGDDHPAAEGIRQRAQEEIQERKDNVQSAKDHLQSLIAKGASEDERRIAENKVAIAEATISTPTADYVPEPSRVCFPPIPEEYSVVPEYPPYSQSKPSDNPIVQISAGTQHNLAVSKSGHLYSWGLGETSQLGLGKQTLAEVPTLVRSANLKQYHALQASAGGQHCCVLAVKGKDEEGRPLKA